MFSYYRKCSLTIEFPFARRQHRDLILGQKQTTDWGKRDHPLGRKESTLVETSTFITSSTRYFILLLVFPVVFILLPVLPVVFATLVLPEGEVIGKAGGSQYGDILGRCCGLMAP